MPRKILTTAILLAALVLVGTHAQAGNYQIDASHSSVGFSVRHIFTPVKGVFSDFSGNFQFDKKSGQASGIDITVKAASINTQNKKRDDHLRGTDFFKVKKFQQATFKSKNVSQAGDKQYKLHGDLTIHGVTKAVVFDVVYLGSAKNPRGKEVAGFSATTKIDRKDFGIVWNKTLDNGGLLIGNEVELAIQIEALKKK